MQFPPSVEKLIYHFRKLPSVGPKSAERFVLSLLKRNPQELLEFARDIEAITNVIHYCGICHNISETDPCPICADSSREKEKLCVIGKPSELLAIENSGEYKGYYHILWGYLSAIEGNTPDKLKINELIERIDKEEAINELILAFNLSIEGESTMTYLTQLLQERNIKITRLGRGLSMGSELEYADDLTIANALKWRVDI